MQIRETIDNSSTASTESPPEYVIVLVDSAGVALGVRRMKHSIEGALRREAQARPTLVLHRTHRGQTLVCHWQQSADGRLSCHWGIEVQPPPFLPKYAFSAKVRADRPGGVSIASRWVEIPLVDGNGQISGVLCQFMPPFDVRGALVSREPGDARAIEDVAQLVVHDINNFLAVIGSGLRLLEGQSDSADRKVIVVKMQHAISRGALLSRQLLDATRPRPNFDRSDLSQAVASQRWRARSTKRCVRASRSAPRSPPICGTSTPTRKNCISRCSTCAATRPMLCPDGARNVDPSAAASWGFVEIVVADEGEGMPEEVLSQALTPYFTTKAAGGGTGLGLVQVQRFAEGRGGTISIESEQGADTLVRLFLPRVCGAAVLSAAAETDIASTPSPDEDGGVFHIVNAAATAPTS